LSCWAAAVSCALAFVSLRSVFSEASGSGFFAFFPLRSMGLLPAGPAMSGEFAARARVHPHDDGPRGRGPVASRG
jgi:hypothetical protein